MAHAKSAPAPHRRIVALGASNLTRLLPTLFGTHHARVGGPVAWFAALGNGRSYGVRSSFLARTLPGIADCGLWDALDAVPRAPTLGIVMDVGNDILYGFDVPTIVGWVEHAIARLRPHVDELAIAGLPVGSLDRVGALRFGFVRTVLVPGCPVPRATAAERALAVDAALAALAARVRARFVVLDPAWYGFDPVHVRRAHHASIVRQLLGMPAAAPTRASHRMELASARAATRTVFGVTRTTSQPAVRLADGSTIALY